MKMLLHKFIQCLLVAVCGVLIVSDAIAQSLDTDKQIGLRLQTLTTGEKILHWNGQANYTYFIQATPDLSDWTWAPNIEPGIAAPMSYEVDGPTAKGFFRLIRSDQTAVDLDTADFDGDDLSNLYEPRTLTRHQPIRVRLSYLILRVRLSHTRCHGSGAKAAHSARQPDLIIRTARRS